jgi:hypothetical protein
MGRFCGYLRMFAHERQGTWFTRMANTELTTEPTIITRLFRRSPHAIRCHYPECYRGETLTFIAQRIAP